MDERTTDGKVVNPATGSSFHVKNFASLSRQLRVRNPTEQRAEARHSLDILTQLNQIDFDVIHARQPSNSYNFKRSISDQVKKQIPTAIANLMLLGPTAINTPLFKANSLASFILGTNIDFTVTTFVKASAERMSVQERKKLKQIEGFETEGINESYLRYSHFEKVLKGISAGLYSDKPDVELVALTECAKSYISGNGDLISGIAPFEFSRVEALLDACKRVFGEEIRNGQPMSAEQARAFSMVRSAIEICLLNDSIHPEVANFIDDTYLSEIDDIRNGAGKDFAIRHQAVNQCAAMFSGNIPEQKKQSKIYKILETIGVLNRDKEPKPIEFPDPAKMSDPIPEISNGDSIHYDPEKTDAEQGIVMGEIIEEDGLQGPGAGTDVLEVIGIEPTGVVDIPTIETTTPSIEPRGLNF